MSDVRVAFVGQCHTIGYEGVPPDATFPEVCREVLQSSRPEQNVELLVEQYFHPSELGKAVKNALRRRARVVVIEIVGWLAISSNDVIDLSRLPRSIRSAYQRAQHLRRAARLVSERTTTENKDVIFHAQKNALAVASSVLRPLLPRCPRPTVPEYESAVADAIDLARATPGVSVVIQGPGAPNLTLDSRNLASDAVERYRAINEMARRVANAHEALYVDRWDTVAGGFFTPGSIRPTAKGHSAWGHLLADHLLRAGLV